MNPINSKPTPAATLPKVGARPLAADLDLFTCASVLLFVATLVYPLSDTLDLLRLLVLAALVARLAYPLLRTYGMRAAEDNDERPTAGGVPPTGSGVLSGIMRVAGHPLFLCALAMALFFCTARLDQELYSDEGLWYYIAFAWLKYHLPPYIGSVENKTPGIFYLFTLCYHVAGLNFQLPRLLGVLANTVTCATIYQIGKLLFDRLAGVIAVLLFAVLMTNELVDGKITSMPEVFMVCFTSLAFLALLTAGRSAHVRTYLAYLFLSGALLGAAMAFKQIAVVTAVAVVLWYLLQPCAHKRGAAAVVRDLLLLAGGMLLSTVISLLPLLLSHVPIMAYIRGAWLVLLNPHSLSGAISQTMRIRLALQLYGAEEMQLLLVLLIAFLLLKTPLAQRGVPYWGIAAWVVCDSLGVNSAGSYFGHQVRQLVPSFAVMSGLVFSVLLREAQRRERLPRWSIAVVLLGILCLWSPSNVTMFLTKPLTWHDTARLGQRIKAQSTPADAVYIFNGGDCCGNTAMAYTERRSPTRFFNRSQFLLPGAEEEIRHALYTHPPRFMVIPDDNQMWLGWQQQMPVPRWTQQLLRQRYSYCYRSKVNEKWGYRVYERRDIR